MMTAITIIYLSRCPKMAKTSITVAFVIVQKMFYYNLLTGQANYYFKILKTAVIIVTFLVSLWIQLIQE